MSDETPEFERTSDPFTEAIATLMRARPETSLRALAREAEVSPGYLSRVVRGKDGKQPSPELLRRLSSAFSLPEDYFHESRVVRIVTWIEADGRLAEEIYHRVTREELARRG